MSNEEIAGYNEKQTQEFLRLSNEEVISSILNKIEKSDEAIDCVLTVFAKSIDELAKNILEIDVI